jgi:ribose transport system substrate-binding protein
MFSPWTLTRLLLVLVAFLALGCGSDPAPIATTKASDDGGASPAESKGTVGVSVLTTVNPFFNVIGQNIKDEMAKAGYETVVVSGEMDIARQQQQVRDFIVAGLAAIVLCPCDSKAIGPVIREANQAGIPVFTADIACLAEGAEVVSHIATDNLDGGRQAGEAMIEALGAAGGKVVILDYKAAESCILRVKGFRGVIDKHNAETTGSKIEIVAELPGDGDTAKGDQATQDALQSHPDLAGIFAINDPSAIGAIAALERAGKADQVKLIGFDGQKEGKQLIKAGKIYADPIQYPDRIGQMTAKSILDYLAGKEVPKDQLIPTGLYRQADGQADPELK